MYPQECKIAQCTQNQLKMTGIFPIQGLNLCLLAGRFFTTEPSGKPQTLGYQGKSQHGPSLPASTLENGASRRLRLREGRAPIKVTQHNSSKDRTRA